MPSKDSCTRTLNRRQVIALLAAFGVSREALAQDAARTNARSYKVVFENDRVRVLEYVSRPGLGICGRGRHSHPPHLNVLLTDSKAKITTADGKTFIGQKKGRRRLLGGCGHALGREHRRQRRAGLHGRTQGPRLAAEHGLSAVRGAPRSRDPDARGNHRIMRLTLPCVIRPGSAGDVPSGAQGGSKYAAALRTRASAI